MGNISTKINLTQLHHQMMVKGDEEYIIMPVKKNHFFKGEKGLYLDLQGFELKNKKTDSKDTHLVKQQLPKEVFDKMTDEQKKETPILGNHILWGGGSHAEPEPQTITPETGGINEADLPF